MGIKWLNAMLKPDPRIEKRLCLKGVVAHCWDGSVPRPRDVLNISLSGAYLRTRERWYPETVIKIILQFDGGLPESRPEQGAAQRTAFCLLGQVVRSGPDGVGLRFLFPCKKNELQQRYPECATDRRTLRDFLERIERLHAEPDRLQCRPEAEQKNKPPRPETGDTVQQDSEQRI